MLNLLLYTIFPIICHEIVELKPFDNVSFYNVGFLHRLYRIIADNMWYWTICSLDDAILFKMVWTVLHRGDGNLEHVINFIFFNTDITVPGYLFFETRAIEEFIFHSNAKKI